MSTKTEAQRFKQKMAEATSGCSDGGPAQVGSGQHEVSDVRVRGRQRATSSSSSCTAPLTQHQFHQHYQYIPSVHKSGGQLVRECIGETCRVSGPCVSGCVTSLLPILRWLPNYSWRQDLLGDLIAGATTAIMHIPQGMAYAMLARIPPIHGIYMAFFQCLFYVIFGTSRHVSVGTFAVVCIMTGKVVSEYSDMSASGVVGVAVNTSSHHDQQHDHQLFDPVIVASTVTLTVGLIELVMYMVRMGALTVLLSDMLVKGFTTGAAVHVFMSQVKSLFGLSLTRYSGPGKLVKSLLAILQNAFSANPAAMVISGVTISVLVFNNEYIKPRLAKKTRFPLPIELLVVIAGTLTSHLGHLHDQFNVQVIGHVSTGLPSPQVPAFSLIPSIITDCVIIAIIAYSVALGMSQLFAKKHQYNIDANQELVAYGVGNVASSFFSCAPMSASLSRSLIQESVGGRTQASGVVTAALLLAVLLWLGPVFQNLPNCVLSSIIVVSLKGMFLQFSDLKQVWHSSKPDALIWFSTFAAVVFIDIDIGLAVGVCVSVIVLLLRSQRPRTALLACVPGTSIYLDVNKYHAVVEDMDIKIFRFGGPVHFCNRDFFRDELVRLTELDPVQYRAYLTKLRQHNNTKRKQHRRINNSQRSKDKPKTVVAHNTVTSGSTYVQPPQTDITDSGALTAVVVGLNNAAFEPDLPTVVTAETVSEHANSESSGSDVEITTTFHSLVLDMSCVGFVDTASARTLISLISDYHHISVNCYLAACDENVLRLLRQCGCTLDEGRVYASVHDAVLAVRRHTAASCIHANTDCHTTATTLADNTSACTDTTASTIR